MRSNSNLGIGWLRRSGWVGYSPNLRGQQWFGQPSGFVFKLWHTEFFDVAIRHMSIGVNLHSLESIELYLSSTIHSPLNLTRRFSWLTAGQIPILHCRDLDVNINSVRQGTGDL
jgi:hypothetical protein